MSSSISPSDGELLAEDEFCFLFNKNKLKIKSETFLKVEGSPRIWRRFVALPNVEGQKYTFGGTYESREEQGEFIFWYRNNGFGGDRIPSICEITVKDGKYWVSPLGDMGEEDKIWINYDEVTEETEMKFGDFLILGGNPDEEIKHDIIKDYGLDYYGDYTHSYPRVLWFRKKELNPDAFLKKENESEDASILPFPRGRSKTEKYAYFGVGHNPLVLSIMSSYLDVENLKKIRLVSKLWNHEAVKVLKKKSQVNFVLDKEWLGHWDRTNDSHRFFRYSALMRDNQNAFPNWKIDLPSFGGGLDSSLVCCRGTPGLKLRHDLNFFLSKDFGLVSRIKRLNLGGSIRWASDFKIQFKILKEFEETLEELELSNFFGVGAAERYSESPPKLGFEKLQQFTCSVYLCYPITQGDANSMSDWWAELITAISGVKSLIVHGTEELNGEHIFLPKLESFPNLEEISMDRSSSADITSFLSSKKFGTLKKVNGLKI